MRTRRPQESSEDGLDDLFMEWSVGPTPEFFQNAISNLAHQGEGQESALEALLEGGLLDEKEANYLARHVMDSPVKESGTSNKPKEGVAHPQAAEEKDGDLVDVGAKPIHRANDCSVSCDANLN